MSFNNGYYFFEHADDKVSGYIMFRRSGQIVRIQVLVENLNVQADACSIFLSNANSDKLYLSDIPLKKLKNGRKTASGDVRYDESNKPEIKGFDCAHIVVNKKSVLEAFSGSIRQFDRDMFIDRKRPVTTIPKQETKKPEQKPNIATPVKEIKQGVKPEPKLEIKQDPKPEPKLEIKQDPKPEPKPEIKQEPKVEIKQEPKVELKQENTEKPKPKWEWVEDFSEQELMAEDIYETPKNENYPDDVLNKMLKPFDPFNTTNKAYSWWVSDNFKEAADAFSSINVTIPSIISKFLYNNIENHKHALIGRYVQDGRKFIILGIPSEKYIANSVARWMKSSVFYTNTGYTGYLLYYIDTRNSSLVKAVQAD